MIKNFSHRMMRLESTLLITELPMQARRGVGGGGCRGVRTNQNPFAGQ